MADLIPPINSQLTRASQRGGDHRSPRPPEAIQQHLAGTETTDHSKSNIQNPTSLLPWPDRLPEQVAILRKLISGYDKSVVTPDAEARTAHAAQNLGTTRGLAMNLVGQEKSNKRGIKGRVKRAGWDNTYLEKILTN